MDVHEFIEKIHSTKEPLIYIICSCKFKREELYNSLSRYEKTTQDFCVLTLDTFHPKESLVSHNFYPRFRWVIFTNDPLIILQASEDATFYKQDDCGDITQPIRSVKNWTLNILLTSPLFDLHKVSFGDDTDTSDDFLYMKIHKAIAKQYEGLTESDVEVKVFDMLTEEIEK